MKSIENFQPVIKWSGSKRSQVNGIITHFPRKIQTYYEPFLGGGSMLMGVLLSEIIVDDYVCSDKNADLILLWKLIQTDPDSLYESYKDLWNELNINEDIDRRKEFFNGVRGRFNDSRDPHLFNFLMRTCVNGMPRYNTQGNFNTSLHLTRNGINPDRLNKIIKGWSEKIKMVTFLHQDYTEVKAGDNDFLYLDPPYFNTKSMYHGGIDIKLFEHWLTNQHRYVLSFDGKIENGQDYTYELNRQLFDTHIYIESGNSSFRRLKCEDKYQNVLESLYIKS